MKIRAVIYLIVALALFVVGVSDVLNAVVSGKTFDSNIDPRAAAEGAVYMFFGVVFLAAGLYGKKDPTAGPTALIGSAIILMGAFAKDSGVLTVLAQRYPLLVPSIAILCGALLLFLFYKTIRTRSLKSD